MFPPIQFQVRLVHAESGNRVVEVTALRGTTPLGSALGEATNAEEAERRALDRLLNRLGPLEEALPANPTSPVDTTPPGSSPAHPPVPAPAAETPASRPGPRLPPAAVPKLSASPARSGPATTTPAAAAASPPPAAPPPAGAEPAADPEDWSSELASLDLQLRRLGWSRDQEAAYLLRAFGHPSRSRLTSYADLKAYLTALEGLAPAADPTSAPVPLRRRDLLAQSDQLLGQLGWKGEQARQFLEQQLGATSRQQLNDSQLLHFNMLLESELLEQDPAGGRMAGLPPSAP